MRAANAAADASGGRCPRLSMDTKATVVLGDYSRRGRARGLKPVAALDHDLARDKERLIPVGILEVKGGDLDLTFSTSPAKTADLMGDCFQSWWRRHKHLHPGVEEIVLNLDNGPESGGRRTRFLARMAEFADWSGLRLHLVYYPPYHSKYNPVERCWGVLEKHWNGALLTDVAAALGRAATMTWRGGEPLVRLVRKAYAKGRTVAGAARRKLEARLRRHPDLRWWDIRIHPQRV